MPYTIYVADTETTGLDPEENDVIEVSFARLSDDDQKTWCLKAMNPATISDKALQINGHKRDDIIWKTASGRETYGEPSVVLPEIESWILQDDASIQERVLVGQNIKFDVDMLRALWKKAGTPQTFPFTNFYLDTIQITRLIDVCTGRKRERYNLGSLVRDFGVTRSKAHRTEGDVKMTRELYQKQVDPIREFVASTFAGCYEDTL